MNPVAALSEHPDVVAASNRARTAIEKLRWHPALRRRTAEVATEARVHSAQASAALEGAKLPVDVVRAISVGEPAPTDGVGATVAASVRSYAHVELVTRDGGPLLRTAPKQTLATLHTITGAGLFDQELLGRPRRNSDPMHDAALLVDPAGAVNPARVDSLWELLSCPVTTPALVVAALALAEIQSAQIFPCANGLVARATFKAIIVARGLDPLAVSAPEVAAHQNPGQHANYLADYVHGGTAGVLQWINHCADLVVGGAIVGTHIADAVLGGKFPSEL